MAVPINTNLDFFSYRISAAELVADWLPVENPWVNFFGKEGSDSTIVKYPIAIDLKVDASKIDNKDLFATYAKSELNTFTTVKWEIATWFIKKNHVPLVDVRKNQLRPTGTIEMALAVTNRNKLSKSTLAHYLEIMKKYIGVETTADDSALEILKAMLKVYDTQYQNNKIFAGTKFITKNNIYDKLVYLNDNKGVVGDNTITQALRFYKGKLTIKDIEVVIEKDSVFPDTMDIIFADGKGFKFYYLIDGNFSFEIGDRIDEEMPKFLFGRSEIFGDLIPYLSPDEKKDNKPTRWAKGIKVKAGSSDQKK